MTKPFALDHVFILTRAVDAPEADKLVEFGLVEGPPNTKSEFSKPDSKWTIL